MSEIPKKFSLAPPPPSIEDEYESARILIREGLLEEAKKTLFKIITHHQKVDIARVLLKEIEELELKELLKDSSKKKSTSTEDQNELIAALDRDLGLKLKDYQGESDQKQKWVELNHLTIQAYFDLGIGYYEMGCFGDAFRELSKAVNKIRMNQSVLGEMGLMSVALVAHCLIELGRPYEAKSYLDPVLLEPEIKHEDKIVIYYAMGLAEEALGNKTVARGWFQKTVEIDVDYKDASYRLRQK